MGVSVYKVPRRLYWTADKSRLVPHGDVDAAFLAFPSGYELSLEEARRFRLLDTLDTPVVAPVPEKMVAELPRNKMRGRPPANKATGAHVESTVIEP